MRIEVDWIEATKSSTSHSGQPFQVISFGGKFYFYAVATRAEAESLFNEALSGETPAPPSSAISLQIGPRAVGASIGFHSDQVLVLGS